MMKRDLSAYITDAGNILQEINDLKRENFEKLKCYDYDEKTAKIALPFLENYYDLHIRLIPIIKKHGIPNKLSHVDFVIYNMANCFITLRKYNKAEKIFDFGFKSIPKEYIMNLDKAFVLYCKHLENIGKEKKAKKLLNKYIDSINLEKFKNIYGDPKLTKLKPY